MSVDCGRWQFSIPVLAGLLALTLSGLACAQPSSKVGENQHASLHQRPIAKKPSGAMSGKSESEKERQEKLDLDRKLVNFNGDLAHYTKWLAYIAALQFFALFGQVIFLRLAFKESQRAGNIARDAMIAGERAFVFAIGVDSFWERDKETNDFHWRFRPRWHNSGDTPTKNLNIYTDGILSDSCLPPDFKFPEPKDPPGTGLLAPKMTQHGGLWPRTRSGITPQDILDVQQGRKHLYIWGWATYHDVFPETDPHVTKFCWYITPRGNPITFIPESSDIEHRLDFPYSYHGMGNCADSECNGAV